MKLLTVKITVIVGIVERSGTGRTHFSSSAFVEEERCELVFVSTPRL